MERWDEDDGLPFDSPEDDDEDSGDDPLLQEMVAGCDVDVENDPVLQEMIAELDYMAANANRIIATGEW
ncbi:MAG: hypothetical protein M3R02_15135 [Chloroflexota bacterium]|nr:hypothetical protein [Chloroflexota bacterium]